jgi:FAD:protein FMN transferase
MMLRLATHAMGTRFELVIPSVPGGEVRLRAAGEEALAAVVEWHARLNRFAKDSELSHINRQAPSTPVRVDAELMGLLLLCRGVWERSGGAFDPAVAPMMDALRGGAPEGKVVSGMEFVELDERGGTVRLSRAGVGLDLGGIAKGFALDHAEQILRRCGVERALMHGGTSSILAIGAPPGRQGWTIGIESAGETARWVLRDAHLSVSAAARAGRGHIVDPRDGSLAPAARTVAVMAASGAVAEAWSTALCVLGARTEVLGDAVAAAVHDAGAGWRVEGEAVGFEVCSVGAAREVA